MNPSRLALVSAVPCAALVLGASIISACIIRVSGDGLDLSGLASMSHSFPYHAERQETHALSLSPGEAFALTGASGDVRVIVASDGRAEIELRIRASGRTQAEADALLAGYHAELAQDGGRTRVRLVGEPLDYSEGSTHVTITPDVDCEVRLPAGTPVEIDEAAGDLTLRGPLGACRLETSYGEIDVEDVRGGLEARTGAGDVSAARLDGGALELHSDYGDVTLEDSTGERVECASGSGDVEAEHVRAASVALTTDYGDVEASAVAGDLSAHTSSGDVDVDDLEGALDAHSDYGDVAAEGVLSGLRAHSGSGSVGVRARAGSRVEKSWELGSDYGDVTLWVSEGFGCELDARTDYGSVRCEFTPHERHDDDHLESRIGAGGGRVTLRSSSGDVALRKD